MDLIKKIWKSLVVGTVMGILIALITSKFVPDLIDRLEHQSYYMRYYWKYMELKKSGSDIAKDEDETGIYIVDIDDRSLHKLGLYWNWNRSYHAEMIKSLSLHYPAAVVFDINFDTPEDENHQKRTVQLLNRSKETSSKDTITDAVFQSIVSSIDYDKQFIKETKRSGVVFNGVRLSSEHDYPDIGLSQIAKRGTLEWHNALNPQSCITIPTENRSFIRTDKSIVDGIFPELAQVSRAVGYINMDPNDDGVIREVPLMFSFGKNEPVYLPISVRTAATLFGTPNEEIHFEPGRFIDLGKPFKIFKDNRGIISFSYPNLTISQIKAILEKAHEIQSLAPGKKIAVSSLLKIGLDQEGNKYISMNCGDFPAPVVEAFFTNTLSTLIESADGTNTPLAKNISLVKESDEEWVLMAPFGDEEWYLTRDNMEMLARLNPEEFLSLKPDQERLVFHNLEIRNRGGVLLSSIPVLRDKTLHQLCQLTWDDIEAMAPGTRHDIGENVRIPLTPENKHIITYFGKRKQPFKYYSYYDIMKNRVQGGLDGKIYLVGSTVSGMFDIVSTPIQNVYPGVEVHASLLNSFITNTFVNRLKQWQDFLILLLVGVITGIFAYMLKPLVSSILTFFFIFGYFLFAMTVFGTHHLWIEIARPILTIILTYTAVMAFRYITEEKDRKFLQSTFKQYLSPELIDTMYKNKQMPKLGGDEGVRTAYFTDIQGFSTFSEKLGSPTKLVELLNEYLTAMTDSLMAHFGTLDKYEGDAIIAFFGAPMPMEDHAQQACATALDMQRRLATLREKWTKEGDKWPKIVHNMRMRIGINTGEIVTGNMGSAVRMNYTMMGDAVNLAARLEGAAKQYGIYNMISDFTYDIVNDSFLARQLDKITVVGKSEPVIVYELLGEKDSIDTATGQLMEKYEAGLKSFYAQQWDQAISFLKESELLEPFKDIAPGGMSPSKRIIEYCEAYKADPPGPDWDGVTKLTSK